MSSDSREDWIEAIGMSANLVTISIYVGVPAGTPSFFCSAKAYYSKVPLSPFSARLLK